jgi:hypothetical protein
VIRAIRNVIRGEGFSSAVRRTQERIGEAAQSAALRARGAFVGDAATPILNIAASETSLRLGGLQAQLIARLDAERALRNVALVSPGVLDLSQPVRHSRHVSARVDHAIRPVRRSVAAD